MKPDLWRRVEESFDELADLPADGRSERLDGIRKTDPELHAELRLLIEADLEADERLAGLETLSQPDFEPLSDPVPHLNAALEGRYRIERELGEGGMATVYLADDIKHERKVALKVLKPELAAAVGAERFLAEIKTTANLQHPHILPLFDSGEADSFLFYVMPYVEGESLRDKLNRDHQLPVDDAVQIAKNVAEALDYAHERGVIHRDIKPANLLLQAGKPVISDFGIALAVSAGGTDRLTETGLTLGTPHYMSPEQATGDQHLGPATDIYALGCVLYEMLVGEPPFTGRTPQAVLVKIIAGAATPVTGERKSVPQNADAAIRKALEKVPADRFTRAQDFAHALADPTFRHGAAGASGVTSPWNRLSRATTAVAFVAILALGWTFLRSAAETPPSVQVVRLTLDLEAEDVFLAPDGSGLVFQGRDENGGTQFFARRWPDLTPSPIPGLAGIAGRPVISPTGDEIAFVEGGQLKAASLGGGVPRTLTDSARESVGWGTDGFIYYSRADRGISRVPANGGEVEAVTELEDEAIHNFVAVLPDGEVAVFTVLGPWGLRIEAVHLNTGERRVVSPGARPFVTPTGHLVFASSEGQILAAPLDPESMELTEPAVPLVSGVRTVGFGYPLYSLSQSGTLIYVSGDAADRLEFVWVTRSGQATPVAPGHTFPRTPDLGWRLSPDETRIAFAPLIDGNVDVRIKHIPDGPEDRITVSENSEHQPFWTRDGRSVIYFTGPTGGGNVWSTRADGTGEPIRIYDGEVHFIQGGWSPDGSLVLRTAGAPGVAGLRDIMAFRPGIDSTAAPLIGTPEFSENSPAVSPDGRWLAYSSNETGRQEVYVRPFHNVDSTRVPVSKDGGIGPVWAKRGGELFFMDAERNLMAAQFDLAAGRVLDIDSLFTIPAEYPTAMGVNFYDVSSDGERFLMARSFASEDAQVILILNFFEELKARVGN